MPDREYLAVPVFDTIPSENVPEGYAFGAAIGGYAALCPSVADVYLAPADDDSARSSTTNSSDEDDAIPPRHFVERTREVGGDYYLFPSEEAAWEAIESFEHDQLMQEVEIIDDSASGVEK